MSVLLETSLGELVIDLEVDKCPRTCENFLKLCKVKYYTLNAFFNVSKNFIAQTGDPTASGSGGESFASWLHKHDELTTPPPPRYFPPEITTKLKHAEKGTVSMAVAPIQPPGCGSQFFITLADGIDYLDGKHAVFGHVVEGLETLDKINEAYLDAEGRPLQDIRIRHIEILEDPFPDPEGLVAPPSPLRPPDGVARIADDEDAFKTLSEEQAEEERRRTAASSSALTLEMIGDLPFAAVRPPENILFVCKLNPVTQDEDLELIFSRFGKILSCEVVRDRKSGDSLQYAFIEFDEQASAEQAYFKMQNVLVDDRRIWVDFSQSVAKMKGLNPALGPGGGGGFGGGRGGRGGMRGGRGGGAGGREQFRAPERDAGYKRNGGGGEYEMVFEEPRRKRSRSPRRERERDTGSSRDDVRRSDRDRRDRDRHGRDDRRSDRRDRDRDRDDRGDRHGDRRDRDRDYDRRDRDRRDDRDRHDRDRRDDRDRDRDRPRR